MSVQIDEEKFEISSNLKHLVLHVYLTWNNKQYIQTNAGNPYTTGVTGGI